MGVKGSEDVQAFEEPVKPANRPPPWIAFKNYIVDSARFYQSNPVALGQEFHSGFFISIVQVPESVAFSLVAGVHPTQGLYGSFWLGLFASLCGGRPGMVSGCAGAFAVVIGEVMRDSGPFGNKCPEERREYLLFVMVLTGLLQLLCAIFQFARLVKLIPKTVCLGFFNGLAVLIFLSQVDVWKKSPSTAATAGVGGCRAVDFGFQPYTSWYHLDEDTAWLMITEVAIVMFFMGGMYFLPKIPMGRFGKVGLVNLIPPSLVGILLAVGYEWGCLRPNGWTTPVVKDVSQMNGTLSPWHVPDVPWDKWETWSKSLPIAISLCFIGLIESMLTVQALDQMLDQRTCTGKKTLECFAQGLGNLMSGFFMGLGGDATINQSVTNVSNGARGRLSAFIGSLFMLLWTGVLGDFIEGMPTAALAGVLFIMVLQTFKWTSLAMIFRMALPLHMCVTIVLVAVLSVFTNLAIGVGAGILWESVAFVWTESSRLNVSQFQGQKLKTYRVEGSLFFANSDVFSAQFTPEDDPRHVVVDFANSRVLDSSALDTLNALGKRYASAKKRLLIRMREEDYDRYASICDEKGMAKKDPVRKYMPTNAVKEIHGRVIKSPLLPFRYQEFEPLARRKDSKGVATHSKPDTPEVGGPRQAAGASEAAAPAPEVSQLSKPQSALALSSLEDGGSQASTAVKAPREDAVVEFDATSVPSPSPPPSGQAPVLMTDVNSPAPSPPGGGGSADANQPVNIPGVPQGPAAAGDGGGTNSEDDASWVSEESV